MAAEEEGWPHRWEARPSLAPGGKTKPIVDGTSQSLQARPGRLHVAIPARLDKPLTG
jgi:hypothetical protein